MNRPAGRRSRLSRLAAATLALLALCATPAPAQTPDDGSMPGGPRGHIHIQDARLTPVRAGWQLDARAEIRLSPVMRAGLDSGVPLEFLVEVALLQPRHWWFDQRVFLFERRYTLTYYELTRHYRLQAHEVRLVRGEPCMPVGGRGASEAQGSSRNFRSLLAALDRMGTLRGITLPTGGRADRLLPAETASARDQLAACEPLTGPLRATLAIRLDDRALPLPLQPVFSSTWRLASEDYRWPLN